MKAGSVMLVPLSFAMVFSTAAKWLALLRRTTGPLRRADPLRRHSRAHDPQRRGDTGQSSGAIHRRRSTLGGSVPSDPARAL